MIKAELTKGTWELCLYDAPLPLEKGVADFVKHERTRRERTTL
jgi:hypothetical protein